MQVLEGVFWFCLFMTLYPYVHYPLLVTVLARSKNKPWRQGEASPRISLIISVFNEEEIIQQKIENALALDYPEEKLEIVIVSDGSTDRTEDIVKSFHDQRVVLKAYGRAGKTACLNRAIDEVNGEVVVFTDANSMFPKPMLKNIARNFSDAEIGLVTGWTKYCRAGFDQVEAPGLYARLEMLTKAAESRVSSCVGADGAIFAVRKKLYCQLEHHDINDFVIPLNVVGQGRRVVLDSDVYCLEEPAGGAEKEFFRQARITNRTLGAIWRNLQYLHPLRYGWFAVFLLSHKVLRFVVPFFAAGLLLTSCMLMLSNIFFGLVAVVLGFFIVAGGIGWLGWSQMRVAALCSTFLLTNLAQLVGWFRFIMGRADTLWTPQR